jgi:hypothetical protein
MTDTDDAARRMNGDYAEFLQWLRKPAPDNRGRAQGAVLPAVPAIRRTLLHRPHRGLLELPRRHQPPVPVLLRRPLLGVRRPGR